MKDLASTNLNITDMRKKAKSKGDPVNSFKLICGQFLLSSDFYLDMSGRVAKMNPSALRGFNADGFFFFKRPSQCSQ
jgi:hypothetical protein